MSFTMKNKTIWILHGEFRNNIWPKLSKGISSIEICISVMDNVLTMSFFKPYLITQYEIHIIKCYGVYNP